MLLGTITFSNRGSSFTQDRENPQVCILIKVVRTAITENTETVLMESLKAANCENLRKTVEILRTILSNALNDAEGKGKLPLKRSNKALSTIIFPVEQAVEMLKSIGWKDDGEALLSPGTDLDRERCQELIDEFETFIEHERIAEMRHKLRPIESIADCFERQASAREAVQRSRLRRGPDSPIDPSVLGYAMYIFVEVLSYLENVTGISDSAAAVLRGQRQRLKSDQQCELDNIEVSIDGRSVRSVDVAEALADYGEILVEDFVMRAEKQTLMAGDGDDAGGADDGAEDGEEEDSDSETGDDADDGEDDVASEGEQEGAAGTAAPAAPSPIREGSAAAVKIDAGDATDTTGALAPTPAAAAPADPAPPRATAGSSGTDEPLSWEVLLAACGMLQGVMNALGVDIARAEAAARDAADAAATSTAGSGDVADGAGTAAAAGGTAAAVPEAGAAAVGGNAPAAPADVPVLKTLRGRLGRSVARTQRLLGQFARADDNLKLAFEYLEGAVATLRSVRGCVDVESELAAAHIGLADAYGDVSVHDEQAAALATADSIWKAMQANPAMLERYGAERVKDELAAIDRRRRLMERDRDICAKEKEAQEAADAAGAAVGAGAAGAAGGVSTDDIGGKLLLNNMHAKLLGRATMSEAERAAMANEYAKQLQREGLRPAATGEAAAAAQHTATVVSKGRVRRVAAPGGAAAAADGAAAAAPAAPATISGAAAVLARIPGLPPGLRPPIPSVAVTSAAPSAGPSSVGTPTAPSPAVDSAAVPSPAVPSATRRPREEQDTEADAAAPSAKRVCATVEASAAPVPAPDSILCD